MIFLHNTEGITLTRHAGATVTPKSAKKFVKLVLWPVSLSQRYEETRQVPRCGISVNIS